MTSICHAFSRRLASTLNSQIVFHAGKQEATIFGKSDDRACFHFGWMNATPNHVVIQAYSGILSHEAATGLPKFNVQFHQAGERLQEDHWIWFPRIKDDAPTSYEINYRHSKKAYRWRRALAGKNRQSYSIDLTREEITTQVFEAILEDCAALRTVLANEVSDAGSSI